jgi:hypothetical protein
LKKQESPAFRRERRQVVKVERLTGEPVHDPVRVPSPRAGSIWKMPPWAQSLAWIFMLRSAVPVREMTRSAPRTLSVTRLVGISPRWSGILLA